jgi:hypothetical protein
MATTARLDLSVWRNDDVYEFPLRVVGPDLTGLGMRAQIRQAPDTPGDPLAILDPVANGNDEGIQLVSVEPSPEVGFINDIRIRIGKSTRQTKFPYAGELGDSAELAWAFQIAGVTRIVGTISVLAHTIDSNVAPDNRPESYRYSNAPRLPAGGATLKIAADDVAELVIDGADLIGALATKTAIAAADAADARALLVPLSGIERSLRAGTSPLFLYPTTDMTSWAVGAGFGGVAFVVDGVDLVDDDPDRSLSSFAAYLQAPATATRVRGKLYRRPIAQANAAPGAAAGEVVLYSFDQTAVDFGLVAGGGMAEVTQSFPPVARDAAYSYVFAIEAIAGDGARVAIGVGQGAVPNGKPARYSGFYRPNPGADWAPVNAGGSGLASTWSYVDYFDAQAVSARVDAVGEVSAKIERSFPSALVPAGARASDGSFFAATDNHFRWSMGVQVGADVTAGTPLSAYSAIVQMVPAATSAQLRIYQRPTSAGTYSTPPGQHPSDQLVYTGTRPLAELGLRSDTSAWQPMLYAYPEVTAPAAMTVLYDLIFLDANGVVVSSGIAFTSAAPGLTQQQRGFYDNGQTIGAPSALAWSVGTIAFALPSAPLDPRDRIDTASADIDGLTARIAGVFNRGGDRSGFAGSATFAKPLTGDVTAAAAEAVTLTSPFGAAIPSLYSNPRGKLAHANVTGVVVRRASDNVLLVAGVDYLLNADSGILSRAADGADIAVRATYHWSRCRYDAVCIHADTRALVVVAGTERDTDAGEFLPRPNSSALFPLYNARVTDGIALELIPLWYLDGGIHRDLIASRRSDVEQQRRALAPILDMVRAGQTIRVAAVGDSIGAQEGGVSPVDQPNTSARDRVAYFSPNVGADRIAQIPLYDQGDGAGAVHTRTSSIWALVTALKGLGATIEYYNFCIGGTSSGAGAKNGGDPALRAAVWAVQPHLLVTHYGMNETGSDATEANIVDLFTDARGHGVAAMLAIGMPRPSRFKPHTMDAVRKTWRATRRAAAYCGAAFFDPSFYVDDAYIGAMGLSTKELGSADRYHHPGLHEYASYGRGIASLVRSQGVIL